MSSLGAAALPVLLGLIILVLAFAVRLTLLIRADWLADFDESVIGLMALGIQRGERPVFFAGQPYLGAVEAYLTAGLFDVIGPVRQALKIVPLVLSLLWVFSTQVLATRLFGVKAGALAGLASALPTLYVLSASLKVGIGVVPTLVLGNTILLAAIELARARGWRTTAWAGVLGLVTGLAFWWHWLIAYYCVAAGLYLIVRRPMAALDLRCWVALPAYIIGSLPFWTYNLGNDWATFRYLLAFNESYGAGIGPRAVVEDWITRRAPAVLGSTAPVPGWLAWAAVLALGTGLFVPVLAALRSWARRRPSELKLLVFFLLAMPAVYAFSGFGVAAFNPYDIDASGRYVIPLFSAVPLAIAFLYRHGSPVFAGVCLALLMVVGLAGVIETPAEQIFESPYYDRAPASFEPIIAVLDEAGVGHVWTDVGLAHPLMFQSRGRIKAADYLDKQAGGPVRFPDVYRAVEDADVTGFLVAVLPGQEGPMESELNRLEIEYEKWDIGRFALFVPTERVDPKNVILGLGLQYKRRGTAAAGLGLAEEDVHDVPVLDPVGLPLGP